MLGVKGFDKDLATSYGSGVKLEAGKTYKEDGCKVYRNGWHFVEYALETVISWSRQQET